MDGFSRDPCRAPNQFVGESSCLCVCAGEDQSALIVIEFDLEADV